MVNITGKRDAQKIRNRYQDQLDEAHRRVKSNITHLYDMNHKLKWAMSQIEKFRKDIEADADERKKLFSSLQNLLKQETDFEEKMWTKTQQGNKIKSVKINQKFKDSEIEEARYDTMMNYLRKYPKYASKSSFSKILDKITEIEKGIKKTKRSYHKEITDATREVSYFPRVIMEARNKINTYNQILSEGNNKLSEMRYLKSFLFKLSSESGKLNVTIDTLHHKVDEYQETINKIEEEVKSADNELSVITK
jgi:chromosome segregation ATPase